MMTHRATFALDKGTVARLKRLAACWKVSQAEVVRRSLEKAEDLAALDQDDPLEKLQDLFASGKGLDPEVAENYIAQVYEDRKRYRQR